MHTKIYLKVFIDGYLLNKEHQGTTTYIKEIYKKVAFQNPFISFYIGCFKDVKIEKEFRIFKNVHFLYFKNQSRGYRMILEIPAIIDKYKFDFAHFQYIIPLRKNKNCKYIVTIHDVLFNDYPKYFSKLYRYKRNYLFYQSAKKANYVLTVSEYSKKAIKKYYKIKNKNIYITPNGVSNSYFKEYNKEKSKKKIAKKFGFDDFILYVSRIEPRKNQELLLKVYLDTGIFNTSTHLVFIGYHSIENIELNNLLNSLNSKEKNKIHFYENLSKNTLTDFYKAAKMFVYPSKAEGFGIPPIEAGALKIPVLCSNATAMKSFNFFKPHIFNPHNKNEFKRKFNIFYKEYDSIDLTNIQYEIKLNYSWDLPAQVLTSIFTQNTYNLEN